LHGRHQKELEQRGYLREEIERRAYRTLPLQHRAYLAGQAHGGDASLLAGVPGFYLRTGSDGSAFWTLAGRPGLLIPCLDSWGRIRAFRVRPDEPGPDGAKYVWLSSKGRPGGTGSGTHCHVSRPLSGRLQDVAVWVTEGEIKADLASERLGAVLLSIPGVGLWSRCLPDLADLLPGGGRVVIAMDADWRDKPPVHTAAWRLCLASGLLGYEVKVASWHTAKKGLDNLLTAGLTPALRPPGDLPPPDWKGRVASVILAETTAPTAMEARTLEAVRKLLPALLAECLSPFA
jgi:hypothetical protein